MRAHVYPLALWLRARWPAPLAVGRREAWLGSLGVGLGLLCTEWLSRHWLGGSALWFVAPMGASAVLLFLLPASPLAQPWALVGGNVVSAVVGVAMHQWLGDSGAVAALAGTLAVATMVALRCLHPPGGAVALTAVLGGPAVHALGFGFAWSPVAVNSLCMLLLAWLIHRWAGHRYPHRPPATPPAHHTNDPPPTRRAGFTHADLDAALASYGEVLDIDREDLEEILVRAQLHAQRRVWAGVRCEHIMSRDVVSIGPDAPVDEAWRRLAHHKVKALPVTQADGRLAGIVTLHDWMTHGVLPAGADRPGPARTVKDIMTAQPVVARPGQPISELVPGFSDGGLHHMPVVDDEHRVIGMVTQSDLVAALFQSPSPA